MLTSRSVADSAVTSSLSIRMAPSLAASSPAIMRSTVVLPQPDGPSSVVKVPDATAKLTPATAVVAP